MATAVRKTSVTEMAGIGLLQGISLYALTTPAAKAHLSGLSAVLLLATPFADARSIAAQDQI